MATDKRIPNAWKFIIGGSAGIAATCVVQPFDLMKNRMQMSGIGATKKEHTVVSVFMGVLKNEGILAFYNGLSAGVLRQATYTTTRMGLYTYLLEAFTHDGKAPGFAAKAVMGMGAGVVGAFVGTPADVALIRMSSDGRLPPNERRNYKNVIDALIRIAREEGITTWWQGTVATMGRALVVNAAQLATYSQAKQWLLTFPTYFADNLFCHFSAAMISGLVTTVASMPVDIAKTRIQNMKKSASGKAEYSGAIDVFAQIIKKEGILALWKGIIPYFLRLGPHTVFVFIFLEKFNNLYLKFLAEPIDKK